MGRNYDGDIVGSFWFGLQGSNAANRFGYIGHPPEHLEYYFDEDNLKECEKEIKVIERKLGGNLELLDDFYDINVVDKPEHKAMVELISDDLMADYADLVLGRKIRDCIKEIGGCSFTAEL